MLSALLQLLEENGVGVQAQNLFCASLPPTFMGDFILINPTPSLRPFDGKEIATTYRRFNIFLGCSTFDLAIQKVKQIFLLFCDAEGVLKNNFSLGNTYVYIVSFDQDPENCYIGKDENNRFCFSLNIEFYVRR